MALGMERTRIGIEKVGRTVTVPNNPNARLMYYFDCVCSCVETDNDSNIRRLRDYSNYHSLSNEEEALLLTICLALSPDKVMGTIFFPSEEISSNNEFFELSAVRTKLVVSDSFLVGGQQKKVQKVMLFKKCWIENFFLEPLRTIERNHRALRNPPRRRSSGSSCIVS